MSERSDSGSLTSSSYDSEAGSATDTSSVEGYASPRANEVRLHLCIISWGAALAIVNGGPETPPPPAPVNALPLCRC